MLNVLCFVLSVYLKAELQSSCWMKNTDMKFVKNFTPPDFQAKNFTPSILPNFNSFSDKNAKKE